MKQILFIFSLVVGWLTSCTAPQQQSSEYFTPTDKNDLRAPAYPLVTIDPYTSGWSFDDELYQGQTLHWTGKAFPLLGVLRVDGENYRFMGKESLPLRSILPTAALDKWDASYTMKKPAGNWNATDYNDASWTKGKAAFGTPEMQHLSTVWKEPDIWVRRTFDLKEDLRMMWCWN